MPGSLRRKEVMRDDYKRPIRLKYPGSMEGRTQPINRFAKECRRQRHIPLVAMHCGRTKDGEVGFAYELDNANIMLIGSEIKELSNMLAKSLLFAQHGNRESTHKLVDAIYDELNGMAEENGYKNVTDWIKKLIDDYDLVMLDKAKHKLEQKIDEHNNKGYVKELNRQTISKKKEE